MIAEERFVYDEIITYAKKVMDGRCE